MASPRRRPAPTPSPSCGSAARKLLFLAYIGLLLIPSTLTLIPLFLTIQKLHFFNTWWALILPYAATAQPLLVLIFRGFFDQIPRELLESARVDGCTEFQVLARIVAPLTRPVLLTGAILVTINVWGDYLWVTIVIQDPHKHHHLGRRAAVRQQLRAEREQRRFGVRRAGDRHRARCSSWSASPCAISSPASPKEQPSFDYSPP